MNKLIRVAPLAVLLLLTGCGKAQLPQFLSCSPTEYKPWPQGTLLLDSSNPDQASAMLTESKTIFIGTATRGDKTLAFDLKGSISSTGAITPVHLHVVYTTVSFEEPNKYKVSSDTTTSTSHQQGTLLCVEQRKTDVAAAAALPAPPATPHVKAGGYLCDRSYEVMGERQLRNANSSIAFQGCQQIGADIDVNVLGEDNNTGAVKVGNSGGVAWVDSADLVTN